MNEMASEKLNELLKLIVDHINSVTKRQLSTLVVDFVRNSENQYVLSEIIAFQFERNEVVSKSKYNVFRRPMLVKFQLESYFKCDLENVSTDLELKEGSLADDDDDDNEAGTSVDMRAYIAAALKKKDMSSTEFKDIQTPNTVLCRMCNSRINSTSSRYHCTSTMIYSTVMHLRSRLPAHDWPYFCNDNSFTLLSMQRNINSLLGEGPSLGTTTVSNLFLCESCYRLYQEETNLIQLEHQIGVLMKNQSNVSHHAEKSTSAPPSPAKVPILQVPVASSPKAANSKSPSRAGFIGPPSVRNSFSKPLGRPVSAPAGGKLRKQSMFSGMGARPAVEGLPSTTAAERFKLRRSLSFKLEEERKKEEAIQKKRLDRAARGTVCQMSNAKRLTEGYANSFLKNKKNNVTAELLSESDIRDKFRDKNNPSNHKLEFFTGAKDDARKASSITVEQSKQRKHYPKITEPPVGNVVSRTDVPLHLTVCRLAVNLHEVSLPLYLPL